MLTVYLLDNYLFGFGQVPALDASSVSDGKKQVKDMKEDKKDSDSSQKPKGKCAESESCPDGQFSYYIKAGAGKDDHPTVCFNGQYAFSPEKKNGKRGICMGVYNPKTLELEDTRTFDTYVEDSILYRYLRLGMEDRQLILVATVDEASSSLSRDSKDYFKDFGSEAVTKLGFRDAWAMIGQRGLASGKAIEQVIVRAESVEYPKPAEVKGCIAIPMGELKEISREKYNASVSKLRLGDDLGNCGMPEPCASDAFSLRLYSGSENKEGPRICVNGRYVMSTDLNNGGRGLNMVIIDPEKKEALEAFRYDTYEVVDDSASLVAQLKSLTPNQMIVIVAHDDASTSISEDARKALASFGSAYISALAFRDVWAFVGRPNLKGFTLYEDIELGGHDVWPVPVDKKWCVRKDFAGTDKKPDVDASKNMAKRTFCRKYDGYEDFCSAAHIDEHAIPAVLNDTALKGHPIFDVPIMIVPGLGHIATLQQFDALMAIPGINPKMITVLYDQKFEESGLLAKLYDIPTFQLNSSTKYVLLFEKALEEIWRLYPKAEHVIVLEEEVIPAKDFLHFLSQCWTSLNNDATLVGISGWNENGFENVSTLPDTAYRGRMFPGLGFLIKKSFYTDTLKAQMSSCCHKRSWYGWFTDVLSSKEVIFPDVSRVKRRQFLGLTENAELIKEYFNRPRVVSSGESFPIKNAQSLESEAYDTEVHKLISTSTPLPSDNAQDCISGRGLGFYVPDNKGMAYSIYFEQTKEGDDSVLALLCRCFRLFYASGHFVRGKHKDMMRFSHNGNHMFLVGSSSPYYKHKPANYKPVKN